jgi:hypothetical protein
MAFFFQLGCQHRDQSCSHTLDLSPLPNVMFLGACFGREIWDTECGIFSFFYIFFSFIDEYRYRQLDNW